MAQRQGSSNAVAGSILLVVHDFIARSPDELSLAKGDRIELFERCALQYHTPKTFVRHVPAGHGLLHMDATVKRERTE